MRSQLMKKWLQRIQMRKMRNDRKLFKQLKGMKILKDYL